MRLTLTLRPGEDGPASADFRSPASSFASSCRVLRPAERRSAGKRRGPEVQRAYSPANVSNWDSRLEFYIRLLPGGRCRTTWPSGPRWATC